jgi:hypothetical protein
LKTTPFLDHVVSIEGEIGVKYRAGKEIERMVGISAIFSAIHYEPQLAGFGLREAAPNTENIYCGKVVFP